MKAQPRRVNQFRTASWFWLTTFLAFWLTGRAAAQTVLYVDIGATGANDGTSWENAFVFLQDALAIARDGDEVWVAEGVYRPDQGKGINPGDREASFVISKGISLYGGFEGFESFRPSTDWKAHPTVLSGDLLENDGVSIDIDDPGRQDNSCHVVYTRDVVSTITLEGVHIVHGNAAASCVRSYGGGMIAYNSSVVLRDVRVAENAAVGAAGGLYQVGGLGFPGGLFGERLEFEHNFAQGGSASIRAWLTRMEIRDSVFKNNGSGRGDGISIESGWIRLIDVTFSGGLVGLSARHSNVTVIGGRFLGSTSDAAIFIHESSTGLIANSFFSGSQSPTGYAPIALGEGEFDLVNITVSNNMPHPWPWAGTTVSCNTCSVRILNSILWSDDDTLPLVAVTNPVAIRIGHSIIKGGVPPGAIDLGGNLDTDPLFLNAPGSDGIAGTDDDDPRLLSGSPAINAGDESYLPPDSLDVDGDSNLTERLPTDLSGSPRVAAGAVDMGAYEYPGTADTVQSAVPETISLEVSEPYPNPFSKSTTLSVSTAVPHRMTVRVIDLLGRLVATPFDGMSTGGQVVRLQIDAAEWPPGTYMVVVDAASHRIVRLATLIRITP